MRIKKNIYLTALIILLIALGLWFYSIYTSKEEKAIKIGYNVESVNHSPIIVAYENNYFDKHGLKVKMVPLKSGGEIKQAIAIGEIDIGSAGATNFFIPISKGAPVKIIAPSTLSSSILFVRPNSISSFKELTGKTIASRIGSSSNFALRYALDKERIDPASITYTDIDKAFRPIALMDKKIVDASISGEYEEEIYNKAGATIMEEWKTKGYLDQSFPRTVIAVNTDFLATNPKDLEKFIDAFIDSQSLIKSNPEKAAQLVARHITSGTKGAVTLTSEEVIKTWDKVDFALWYDPNILVDISKIAKDIGDTEKELTLDEIFDLRFKQKLETAQNAIY